MKTKPKCTNIIFEKIEMETLGSQLLASVIWPNGMWLSKNPYNNDNTINHYFDIPIFQYQLREIKN